MNNHEEFMLKLSSLMKEYDAEFNLTHYDSGCDCCGGSYEFEIITGEGVNRKRSEIHSSYIYPFVIEDVIK